MKIDEMVLVMRVAETGSMTRAAQQLFLTPAAVSAAIKRIEAGLGVQLFERSTRSIRPTSEGHILLAGCEELVSRWQRTLEDVQGSTESPSGVVHITAPTDTTNLVLSPALTSLTEEHPKLSVVLHPGDAMRHLHKDAIDMAVRYGPLADSSLLARRLAMGPGILVAAPAYLAQHGRPRTPDDLAMHRAVTMQISGAPRTSWSLHGPDGVIDVQVRSPLCGDGHLARTWAVAGRGVAMKHVFDVIDDLEAGRLERVLPKHHGPIKPIHAVFPSRRHLPARVRSVFEAVAVACAERSARCERWLERQAQAGAGLNAR